MPARLSVPETLAAAAAAVAPSAAAGTSVAGAAASGTSTAPAPSTSGPLAAGGISLLQERQRRLAAEAAVVTLRQQLDDISAALFSFRSSQGLGGTGSNEQDSSGCSANASASAAVGSAGDEGTSVAAEVAAALVAAATQCRLAAQEAAAQRQRADAAESAAAAAGGSASDAAYVARLVAGICARAAVAADLEASFAVERGSLERRLQQATRMGHAMLKHSKEAGERAGWLG